MDKNERMKKLKRLIKRMDRTIDELEWTEIEVRGVLEKHEFLDIYHSNRDALAKIKRVKYLFEDELQTLQESNENIINN